MATEVRILIAIDTNVAARFLMRDDTVQTAIADNVIGYQAFFISHGVLMELGWVLRSAAGWNRVEINQAIRLLLSLPGANVELPGLINWALEQHLAGGDWADMLHLVANRRSDAFHTFDTAIEGAAGNKAPVPVKTLGE